MSLTSVCDDAELLVLPRKCTWSLVGDPSALSESEAGVAMLPRQGQLCKLAGTKHSDREQRA